MDSVGARVSVDGSSVIVQVGVLLKVLRPKEGLEPQAEHIERRHARGDETHEPDSLPTGFVETNAW